MTNAPTTALPTDRADVRQGSGPARSGRSRPGEIVTVAIAGLMLVVVSPQVLATHWSPKAALALLLIGPGLVALTLATVARERAAIAGCAFVVIAGISAIVAPAPMMSLVGLYNHGTGWLFVAAVVGMWALGRRWSDATARTFGHAVLIAAVLNSAMAWLQSSRDFSGSLFNLVDGRPPGFLGNPVHTTALLLGAFAIVVQRWRLLDPPNTAPDDTPNDISKSSMSMLLLAMAGLFASAIQLAGGRIGIVVLVVVLVAFAARLGWRRAVPLLIVAAVGVGLATLAPASDSGAAARVAETGSSGISGRVDRWRMAGPAIASRPVLGIGPGLYRRATSPHDTVAAAQAFGSDRLNIDAHNVFVEYLVTTGILGTLAMIAWLVLAARGARGELAWFAAVGAISLLLEPQFIGLTPVLALALGAAARSERAPFPRPARAIGAAMVVVGVVAGVALIRGDVLILRTVEGLNPATGRAAAGALPMFPEPARDESRAYSYVAISARRPADWHAAVAAARTAVRRDPSDPGLANELAGLEVGHGTLSAARAAFSQALRWDPYSVQALVGLATLETRQGDQAASNRLCARARSVITTVHCPTKPARAASG